MKQSEMIKALTIAFAQWPGVVIGEPMVDLWMTAFPNVSFADFVKAIMTVLKTDSKGFAPTIAHVNRALLMMHDSPKDQLTEGQCWQLLMQAVQRYGSYQLQSAMLWLKACSDVVHAAAEQLGWANICAWLNDDEVANRAHFWRVVQAMRARNQNAALIGMPRPQPYVLVLAQNNPASDLLKIAMNKSNADVEK